MRSCRSSRARALLAALLALAALAPTAAMARDVCAAAVARAERKSGLPRGLLQAIALTETGRRLDGDVRAWPWAINVEGEGHWFDDRRTALERTAALLEEGRRSIDVGCLQVNLRWHPDAFDDLAEAFDPERNAAYAADFLRRLHAQAGDWLTAAGHYHSFAPARAEAYRTRVAANWNAVRQNRPTVPFFLPDVPGRVPDASELLPASSGLLLVDLERPDARPLIDTPGRPLFSTRADPEGDRP